MRAALTMLLVMLPVVAASCAALLAHDSGWSREREATSVMGTADAVVAVSPYAAVRPGLALFLEPVPAQGGKRAPDRDPAQVDVSAVLPAGSRLGAAPWEGYARLATGGGLTVTALDFGEQMTRGLVEVTGGRAPDGPDEIAVTEPVADELTMLMPNGVPRPDAALALADGTDLRVVGIAELTGHGGNAYATVASDSRLKQSSFSDGSGAKVLVDLPPMTRGELKELVKTAAAAGVMIRPRDAVLHGEAWGIDVGAGVNTDSIVVGALIVLVGGLEVVLLVGAAFAVAARRQVRDLGLLAVNGGAPRELRRVLLAQGLLLGVLSSAAGVLLGAAVMRLVPLSVWGRLGQDVWRQEIDWAALAVIFALGTGTAVLAAVLPAWSISRLSPFAALSGRFPVSKREARAHRGAFILAGAGLALVTLGGVMTARTFAPGGHEYTVAPFTVAVGLVTMLAGLLWATPYLVRSLAQAGRILSLTGRHAFRAAARQRFRTSAASMALVMTVTACVLASFLLAAVADSVADDGAINEMTLTIDENLAQLDDSKVDAAMTATVRNVVGPVETLSTHALLVGRTRSEREEGVYVVRPRDYQQVFVADPGELADALGERAEGILPGLARGAALVVGGRGTGGTVKVMAERGDGGRRPQWVLPALQVSDRAIGLSDSSGIYVLPATARRLGLSTGYGLMHVRASRAITDADLQRLSVRGLDGWSNGPAVARAERLRFAGLLAAGVLSLLTAGIAVALAAAESRADEATLAAVGAAPSQRRRMGAMHGLFLGLVGALLGCAVGIPAGVGLSQLDGSGGVGVPWMSLLGTVAVVLAAAPLAGWLVTPTRLSLDRRVG